MGFTYSQTPGADIALGILMGFTYNQTPGADIV